MKLYHIHLIGNYDELYKEGSEFFIDNKFNNNLYNRIYNNLDCDNFEELVKLQQLLKDDINIRELALEEYRTNNCPLNPSRLHSLFACHEKGLDYWISKIDGEIQVFRIDTHSVPFISSEKLLPDENSSYYEKLKQSYNYYHPNKKQLELETNEYLIQGRVKILERVK